MCLAQSHDLAFVQHVSSPHGGSWWQLPKILLLHKRLRDTSRTPDNLKISWSIYRCKGALRRIVFITRKSTTYRSSWNQLTPSGNSILAKTRTWRSTSSAGECPRTMPHLSSLANGRVSQFAPCGATSHVAVFRSRIMSIGRRITWRPAHNVVHRL